MPARLALVLAVVAAVACGAPPPPPATAQGVALRAGDLPKGLVNCFGGDVKDFLKTAPSGNALGIDLGQQWTTLQQQGAQAGYARIFAGSKDQCNTPTSADSLTGVTWVASLVIQFKNSTAASKGFTQLEGGLAELELAPGTEQGASTGLGPHSLAFGSAGGGQSIYFATWQSARFLVLMLSAGVDEPQARQAARNINSRIH